MPSPQDNTHKTSSASSSQPEQSHSSNKERAQYKITAEESAHESSREAERNPADDDFECVVCMESIQLKESFTRLRCGHALHAGCLDNWMFCFDVGPCGPKTEPTCPICQVHGEDPSLDQEPDSQKMFQHMIALTQTISMSTQHQQSQSASASSTSTSRNLSAQRPVSLRSETIESFTLVVFFC